MKKILFSIIAALVFAGCTPDLHKAAREGDADRVRKLLDAGADVNGRNSSKACAAALLFNGLPCIMPLIMATWKSPKS